ncbi:hypothetical protein ACFFRR_011144 [Megaselia abdita]
MNFCVVTLLVVAAVLMICPAEIAGKKYQKDEHEKKVFTRTASAISSSSSDTKTIHHVKHPKEREVLIRSTRGAKASDNSPAGVGDVIADNAAPGKERKNKKNHKKTLNQSQQLPLSLPHDSSELPSPPSNNNNNKHNRNSNPGQLERHQFKINKRKQPNSENTHETKEHSKNSEGGNNASSCHYVKGNWSECDATTNIRSRILTLKDGDNKECVPTRTIQKKCKKAMMNHGCRYEKGTWSECLNGEQTRMDTLKTAGTGMSSPPSTACEQTRSIKKSCKAKKAKTNKERKNNKLTGRKGRGGAAHH